MIAAWMLYCVAIGLVLTVVGAALERGLHLAGRPTRWAWVVALVGSFVIPAAAWLRPQAFSSVAVPLPPVAAPEPANVIAPLPADAPQATAVAGANAFSLGDLDGALRWGWGASSVALLGALSAAALRLATLRRRWRASVVDGREVLVSENVGPAVAGLWRPEVIVPGWALALGQPQRRLMLSHEEEHVRAADPWLLAAGTAALVLMPWNVALWWQVRRLRLAVEIDCDARVLARGGTTPEYGELLLQVGRRRSMLALGAPALSEPTSFLERRIRRMATALPRWRWAGAAVALAIATAAVIGACEAPRPVEPERPTETVAASSAADLARDARERVEATMARADSAMAEHMRPVIRSNLERYYPDLLREQNGPPADVWFGHDLQGRVTQATMMAGAGGVWFGHDLQGRVTRATMMFGAGGQITTERIGSVFTTFRPGNDAWSVVDRRTLKGLVRDNVRVIWVTLSASNGEVDPTRVDERIVAPDAGPPSGYYDPTPDHLWRLAHQYHPEAFVKPRSGTAIALVFDARDSVIAHAAGVREAQDRSCDDVVSRLVPALAGRRLTSGGCADAGARPNEVVVYWKSLRNR